MIIEEFWVLDWEGKPLYTFTTEEKRRSDLISGFFQTIQSLARNMVQEHVNTISLGESNYNFLHNTIYELYFVLKCSKKTKRKTIKARLSTIESLFIEDYRAELVKPEIDPSKFEKFQHKIEKYLVQDILDKVTNTPKSNEN
ncbi:MAG: hypothetical protein ACTSV5_10340 [Promethearchaeota archaeon]